MGLVQDHQPEHPREAANQAPELLLVQLALVVRPGRRRSIDGGFLKAMRLLPYDVEQSEIDIASKNEAIGRGGTFSSSSLYSSSEASKLPGIVALCLTL